MRWRSAALSASHAGVKAASALGSCSPPSSCSLSVATVACRSRDSFGGLRVGK